MRITLITVNLNEGGTQKVVFQMANYWSKKGYKITILTYDGSQRSFFQVSEPIQWKALDLAGESSLWFSAIYHNIRRICLLRKAINDSKPDYIISLVYTVNVIVLLATRFISVPVFISERNDPRRRKEGLTWHLLRRILYPMADHLVLQNREIRDWFLHYNRSLHVIPNPVQISKESLRQEPETPLPEGKRIVALGRLVEQKGFDLLIQAFTGLHTQYPDWRLVIIGEGPLKNELKQHVRRLNVEPLVSFLGRVKNPFSIFSHSDLFVLSSRYEGFPNALLEAMACGLPVVSFDCPSGPGEIIQDGINGILVPPEDRRALKEAMEKLIDNESLRVKLSKEASKVKERFSIEKIMPLWEKLLK